MVKRKTFGQICRQKFNSIRSRSAAKWNKAETRLLRPEIRMCFDFDQFMTWALEKLGGNPYGTGRCEYCDRPIAIETLIPDHKIALQRGGANVISNLAASCEDCNLQKGETSYVSFRYLRAALANINDKDAADYLERLQKAEKLASMTRRFIRTQQTQEAESVRR